MKYRVVATLQVKPRSAFEVVMIRLMSSWAQLFRQAPRLLFLTLGALALAIVSARAQEIYKTPDDAVAALLASAKSGDKKAALAVFGPQGEEIVSSGDPVNDDAQRKKFVGTYETKHSIKMDGVKKAVLIIGDKDWPFPVTIVGVEGGWHFDTGAGLQEILFRRIGHNELSIIQACLAYVDAQTDYAQLMRGSTGTSLYAQRIVSHEGKKDGLYWPTQAGETLSPLGELVASATSHGYRVGTTRAPYHGYYFKILTRQGHLAPGGAYDYIVGDRMIGGFALVAYPAIYRNSGVMTFLVNHDGVVFEKDLGARTAKIVEQMDSFNPDASWRKVSVEQP